SGLKSRDIIKGISKLYSIPISPARKRNVPSLPRRSPILLSETLPTPPPTPAYQLKPPSMFHNHWYNAASLYASKLLSFLHPRSSSSLLLFVPRALWLETSAPSTSPPSKRQPNTL